MSQVGNVLNAACRSTELAVSSSDCQGLFSQEKHKRSCMIIRVRNISNIQFDFEIPCFVNPFHP